jgi:NAD(P)-dependent dehydrogenase (short-subunit alcohol dehydrogenase family)
VLLRWKLAVVVGGGSGVGREVCLRLARAGAGVLVADRDLEAAEATATLVRQRRVSAWSLRVDPADDVETELLAARCRDLGGADLLVTSGVPPERAARVAELLLPRPELEEASDPADALARLRVAEVGAVICL